MNPPDPRKDRQHTPAFVFEDFAMTKRLASAERAAEELRRKRERTTRRKTDVVG